MVMYKTFKQKHQWLNVPNTLAVGISKNKVSRVMVLGEANGAYKFNSLSNAYTTPTYIHFNQQRTNILLRE